MNGYIRLSVTFPGEVNPHEREMAIDVRDWFRSGLGPLPRGHDDPLDIESWRIANEQLEDRRKMLDIIERHLSYALRSIFRDADPRRGYTASEINRQRDILKTAVQVAMENSPANSNG